MSSLNDFYFNLLHINKAYNEYEMIKQTVKKVKQELLSVADSSCCFCKVLANNISFDLNKKKILNKVINTKQLFNIYEHEFVMAYYKDKDVLKYVLIDPSFEQFINQENVTLINKFKNWPGDALMKTDIGNRIRNDLISDGCSIVDESGIKEYLTAIMSLEGVKDIEVNYEDILPFKER